MREWPLNQSCPQDVKDIQSRVSLSLQFVLQDGHKLDRKLVYSKFRPMKVFRDTSEPDQPDNAFCSCAFTPTDQVSFYILPQDTKWPFSP